MKRLWIMLLAVGLTLVIALPATADKPDKPGKPSPDPVLYDVTLDLADDAEGLGLRDEEPCNEEPLVMVDIDGALLADGTGATSVPRLYLRAEVPWTRTHPDIESDVRFDGCHGGALPESESDVPSYFIIHTDRGGYLSNVLWAFDVYVEEGTNGRNKTPGVKEYFRLWGAEAVSFVDASGDGCLLSPTKAVTCHVSGPFEVWHYYPIEQIGDADFDFTLTITPRTET